MIQDTRSWIEVRSRKTAARRQSNKQVETPTLTFPLLTPSPNKDVKGNKRQDFDQTERKIQGQKNLLKVAKPFTELTGTAKEKVLIKKLKGRNPPPNSQNIKDLLINGFRSRSTGYSPKFKDNRTNKRWSAVTENQDENLQKEKIQQEEEQIKRILIGIQSYQYPFYNYEGDPNRGEPVQVLLSPHLLNGALDYNLFRHQLFALSRKESGILEGTLGIKKQLELLKFIFMQCPYVDIDKPTQSYLLSTSEIFRYRDFTTYEISDFVNASYEIFESYDWCSRNGLINPVDDKSDTISSILMSLVRKFDGPLDWMQNNLVTVKGELNTVRERIRAAITPVTNNINTKSLYYIQSRVENLFELVWLKEVQDVDIVRVKKIAEDIYACLNGCIEYYFEHMEKSYGTKEEWKSQLKLEWLESLIKDDNALPIDIFQVCRTLIHGYINQMASRLKCSLVYAILDKLSREIGTLLRHSSSFVRNRKCLDVNWRLVNTLLSIYEGFSKVQDKRPSKEYSESTPEIITMTADLLFCWYPKSLKLRDPLNEKFSQKIAIPFYYHPKRHPEAFTPQNTRNVYGLDIHQKEQNKIEFQGKKQIEMLEKELIDLILKTLSNDMPPELTESYRTHSQSMELTDIKIIIYSNDYVKTADISPQTFQQIKIKWDKSFQDRSKAGPKLLPAYFSYDFTSRCSEKKQNEADSEVDSETAYKHNLQKPQILSKNIYDQNLTYFNYQFLESLFSPKNKITLSQRTYFVVNKLLKSSTKSNRLLRECVLSMSEIASRINGLKTNV